MKILTGGAGTPFKSRNQKTDSTESIPMKLDY